MMDARYSEITTTVLSDISWKQDLAETEDTVPKLMNLS